MAPRLTDQPGIDGFLGTRAPLAMDLLVTSLLVIVPLMFFSVWFVRYRQQFRWHKRLQLALSALLAIVIVAFEVEVRASGWVGRARGSPYWIEGRWNDWVDYALVLHLLFAVSTAPLWVLVVARAVYHFPIPPSPSRHSRTHRWSGRLAVAAMTLTAISGWVFYWIAFVAR